MEILGWEDIQVNEKGHLLLGGCDAVDLAGEFGTPLYVMDEGIIRHNCRLFRQAFSRVIYASKALMTMAICRIIEEEGLYLDVVSGGELYTALAAGFPPERIYFHGNNKSRDELAMALKAGVGQIVVDNFWELELLARLTEELRREVSIFLRVTPGIEAHTHEYIRTGQVDSKFGFTLPGGQALQAVRAVADIPGLHLKGIHCHIGSQVFQVEPYVEAARVLVDFLAEVRENAGMVLEEINLGGGFGIYYVAGDTPLPPAVYARAIKAVVEEKSREHGLPEPRVAVEPGRSIVGPAGVTLYTVGSIKEITGVRRYVAVDGGMADNIRPALYQAKYRAVLANRVHDGPREVVSITGKCCESGDMLIWDIELPALKPGDILAVLCTGAYGYSMASNYNRLPRPAMVLVKDRQADLIIRRETYQDLVSHDVVPERLRTGS